MTIMKLDTIINTNEIQPKDIRNEALIILLKELIETYKKEKKDYNYIEQVLHMLEPPKLKEEKQKYNSLINFKNKAIKGLETREELKKK